MLSAAEGPLTQGDVVALDYFPLWRPNLVQRLVDSADTPTGNLLMPVWEGPLLHEGLRLAVICSHPCDVENPRSRTGLILAPIVKLPASAGTDRWNDIMASRAIVNNEWDYIQFFPVELPEAWSLPSGVVDFSAMTAMARAHDVLDHLTDRVVGRLPGGDLDPFREKVAAFLGRPYQEARPVSD